MLEVQQEVNPQSPSDVEIKKKQSQLYESLFYYKVVGKSERPL